MKTKTTFAVTMTLTTDGQVESENVTQVVVTGKGKTVADCRDDAERQMNWELLQTHIEGVIDSIAETVEPENKRDVYANCGSRSIAYMNDLYTFAVTVVK